MTTNQIVKLVKTPSDDVKLPAQAQGIIAALKRTKAKELPRAELVERLPNYITTRQSPARILRFYMRDLIDRGFIKLEKVEVEAEAA